MFYISNSFICKSNRFSKAILHNIRAMSSDVPRFQTLSITIPREFVYHVQLNRPERLNALNRTMWSDIEKCFHNLSSDENCRAIVLSGNGKHFTAGMDLQDTAEVFPQINELGDVSKKAKHFYQILTDCQRSMSSLELCRKPVLAAIHAACVGAGVDMITAADMRYCTKDAWFQVKEVDIGMAADVGTLQRLPKVVGSDSLARELCFTARKMPASEALSCGLISRVFDTKDDMLEKVLKIAEDIAKKSPVAIQGTKLSLVYSRDHTVQEGLEHIALWNQMMLQSEDLTKAVMGQMSKDSNISFSKL
ncbi:delta(3,5)-Delta(2,4)-dienoyl-CoA isomerase, mitochondrial [Cylas formicarius]|uniref:delta(3,5)-Delta(2,4)-dienoyl-CoA isomerase, mitochondrial n=1 Tax=Cylas formicarius TaxID=197179 RepID=UPI00295836E8|nr:delta(3,5)-Delta(2,4)-dienoyl-CoA isomerase, mitochondrial [Cylas formicarius]